MTRADKCTVRSFSREGFCRQGIRLKEKRSSSLSDFHKIVVSFTDFIYEDRASLNKPVAQFQPGPVKVTNTAKTSDRGREGKFVAHTETCCWLLY
jgi:hypothetical protein